MGEPALPGAREGRIVDVFVDLADTLVKDFDVVDFFHRLIDRAVPLLAVSGRSLGERDAKLIRGLADVALRAYARCHNRRLSEVAAAVVSGEFGVDDLTT